MANSQQATKRVRQNNTKAETNQDQATKMRTAIKKFEQAIESGEGNTEELFKDASQKIDRAANKGLIHANKASRKKSNLAQLLNK